MSSNDTNTGSGSAHDSSGYGLDTFLASVAVSAAVAAVQIALFFLLRNKLARIYKPKTFLVPERERTEPPPSAPWALVTGLMGVPDREIIRKCGLDAYFFMRYLKTLLVIFVPLAIVIIPILIPVNFVGGIGQNLWTNTTDNANDDVVGLSVLAWGNVRPENHDRRWAHLLLALLVIIWVCFVVFSEMRVYVKVRQDWLTSAEHRLRASANTVLVSSIPRKWLSEDALRGLFDVFPGGIRNIWLTRDFAELLDKIKRRSKIHHMLESAQSDLIRDCKKAQLKQREKDEKKARKELKTKQPTKKERAERQKQEDEEAKRRAEAEKGISMGDTAENAPADGSETNMVHPHADYAEQHSEQHPHEQQQQQHPGRPSQEQGALDMGWKVLQGGANVLKGGVDVVGRAGLGIKEGLSAVGHNIDSEVERTDYGFSSLKPERGASPRPNTSGSDRWASGERPKPSFATDRSQAQSNFNESKGSDQELNPTTGHHMNTVRKIENIDDMYIKESTKWYQFWKPPSGGYASPVPQGVEEDPFDEEKPLLTKIREHIPFMGPKEEPVAYPAYVNSGQKAEFEEQPEPAWEKWIKASDRPTHRIPFFEWTPGWLPGIPFIHTKVDTIYYCRQELARLNLEIEEDQKHPERFPIMTSAFIQFNNQAAAHMACQCTIHHVPKQMAPRVVEISPSDVIWDNMAMSWWMQWLRVVVAAAFVVGIVILWGFPVAFSASLSEIDSLIAKYSWLGFLKENEYVYRFVKLAAGVLPQAFLAIIIALVPIILNIVAEFQGVKTGSSRSEWVQIYYFLFLFVEVFLVVSITSGAIQTLANLATDIESIPDLLAENLPDSSNYFFSYLLLQGASVSSGTLLQVSALAVWYLLARILDSTARQKFIRQTKLPQVKWGSFFPVYTNFACIALVFSVIAPLMTLFAIINFSLLWCAHRYNMLYVTRFRTDTGGVLYPRALNQTFTGLYVMELCLVGLFFLVQYNGQTVCYAQAIIMIVAIVLTALFQIFLNREFGPLLRYLPITFEDEAVLRDRAFQRAQRIRMGLPPDPEDEVLSVTSNGVHDNLLTQTIDEDGHSPQSNSSMEDDKAIELDNLKSQQQQDFQRGHRKNLSSGGGSIRSKFVNPVSTTLKHSMTWAMSGGAAVKNVTIGAAGQKFKSEAEYRRKKRERDLENQRAIGNALFGDYADEIEDLAPAERDAKVRKAFTHSALRARRPVVWIPRDDLGISDDEVRRTNDYSEHIWISNEGTALDSKCRVVYGQAPPDFSEEDIIQL